MKRSTLIKRIIPLLLTILVIITSVLQFVTPLSAQTIEPKDTPQPSPIFVSASESPEPQGKTVAITIVMPDAAPESTLTPEPPPTPEPTSKPPELYPNSVEEIQEDEERRIIKVYVLGEDENPSGICRDSFERGGWLYEIADVTKSETSLLDSREHTETIEVNTNTKDLEVIMKKLNPTLSYESDDGYTGVLVLNLDSVKVRTADSKTSNYTVSATKEYPNLSNNDTSLVPKTISDGGNTLTLSNVQWRAGNTETVDYERLPEYYTAIATYTTTGSKTVVTGYVTTAEYAGKVSKVNPGKTVYTAIFIGSEITATVEAAELDPAAVESGDPESVIGQTNAEQPPEVTQSAEPPETEKSTSTPETRPEPAETEPINPWLVIVPAGNCVLLIIVISVLLINKKSKNRKDDSL